MGMSYRNVWGYLSGQILLDSQPVAKDADLLALRRRFASVFQDPPLIEGTVERNVGLGLQLRRMPQSEARERIRLWMQRLGIEDLASRQAIPVVAHSSWVCLSGAVLIRGRKIPTLRKPRRVIT